MFTSSTKIMEVGCGNGRDASFFAKLGNKVTAIDMSDEAVKFCKQQFQKLPIAFETGKLPDIANKYENTFDVVYSRFVIHAMSKEEEIEMLNASFFILKPNGKLYIECRSIKDPMARKGEVISSTERIFGHYRRFIVLHKFRERVKKAGFRIIEEIESNNLSVHLNDNPVVIRLVAESINHSEK